MRRKNLILRIPRNHAHGVRKRLREIPYRRSKKKPSIRQLRRSTLGRQTPILLKVKEFPPINTKNTGLKLQVDGQGRGKPTTVKEGLRGNKNNIKNKEKQSMRG